MAEAISSRSDEAEVCIMMVGKTGYGKSATGNRILGRNVFKVSSKAASITEYAHMARTKIKGRIVKVVDTPGLFDTRYDEAKSAEKAMEAFNRGVSLCRDGFHALILVYRHGCRMTYEEMKAVEELKQMLGRNVLREYGILLFTFGDTYDEEEVEMNFKDWCLSSEDSMKELIEECNNRCVLFNNKAKDKTELSGQRDELLRCVDGLQSQGKRYTNWVFEEAKATWITLTKEKKYAKVIDQVNTVMGDISNDLVKAQGRGGEMNDGFFNELRKKLRALKGLTTDMEEPEKKKEEDQIKEMDDRILFMKSKLEDDKIRQEQLKELCAQNEALKQQHQEQLEQYQRDYENMQNVMSDKITALMDDSKRRDREMNEILRKTRKKSKPECVII